MVQNIAVTRFYRYLNHTPSVTWAELRPFEIPCFFSYNPESLGYMFRALALVLWLLIAFSSVFTSLMRYISENRKFVRNLIWFRSGSALYSTHL